ncbi:MAG: hypothetical protein JJ974_12665 [Phycisphaerales bacterium]|nr:hypothetical protein [Phycisphaerales bacterium]
MYVHEAQVSSAHNVLQAIASHTEQAANEISTQDLNWLASTPNAPIHEGKPSGHAIRFDQDWAHQTWKRIGFQPTPRTSSHHFQLINRGDKLIIRAVADLDGDGELSVHDRSISRNTNGQFTSAGVLSYGDDL